MEKIKQEINRYINSKNNMWAGLIGSTGGTLALLFNLNSPLKVMFLIIGFLFSVGFFSIYRSKSKYIDYLIEKMGEDDE